MILDQIKKPNDIKAVDKELYDDLAGEIRDFLVEKISKNGGHLGSNLGAVELTMALHLALTLPKDKIIWDVGHQSYTHKLLTGRREGFENLRKFGGTAGFHTDQAFSTVSEEIEKLCSFGRFVGDFSIFGDKVNLHDFFGKIHARKT